MAESSVAGTVEDDAAVLAAPWENRLWDLLPLPPAAAGFCVFCALFGAFLVSQWALGEPVFAATEPGGAPTLVRSARLTFLVTALIGFSAGANLYLPRSIWRDHCESLVDDPARRRVLLAVDPLWIPLSTVRRSRWAGAVGVLASLGVVFWFSGAAQDRGPDGSYAVVTVLTPFLFWLLARSAFSSIAGGRESTPPPEFSRPIDLFDLRPHYCRGRTGLRLALVWLAGTAIALSVLATTGLTVVALSLVLLGLSLGTIAFVLPVRGHHRRVRAQKRAALAALQPELSAALAAHRRGEAGDAGRLADLLALKAHLESVREWPFDDATLWRFALYTLIPFGSWVGGALVERVVGAALEGPS